MQNSSLGAFSRRGDIAIRVYFENLWSHMCTTQVFEWCPGDLLDYTLTSMIVSSSHGTMVLRSMSSHDTPSLSCAMFATSLSTWT